MFKESQQHEDTSYFFYSSLFSVIANLPQVLFAILGNSSLISLIYFAI